MDFYVIARGKNLKFASPLERIAKTLHHNMYSLLSYLIHCSRKRRSMVGLFRRGIGISRRVGRDIGLLPLAGRASPGHSLPGPRRDSNLPHRRGVRLLALAGLVSGLLFRHYLLGCVPGAILLVRFAFGILLRTRRVVGLFFLACQRTGPLPLPRPQHSSIVAVEQRFRLVRPLVLPRGHLGALAPPRLGGGGGWVQAPSLQREGRRRAADKLPPRR